MEGIQEGNVLDKVEEVEVEKEVVKDKNGRVVSESVTIKVPAISSKMGASL